MGPMDDQSSPESDEKLNPPSHKQPLASYVVKGLLGLGLIALAGYDLRTPDTAVPPIVYGIIGGLAAGPDLVGAAKGAIKSGGS